MSLDVWLYVAGMNEPREGVIFVREGGSLKEISRKEWDKRFPGQEPITVDLPADEGAEVFWKNITHNLGTMAGAAGLYEYLWRPDENDIAFAYELIGPLREGLARLKADPAKFKEYNPSNGWGSYEGLVKFVEAYLEACEKYPQAKVDVSR